MQKKIIAPALLWWLFLQIAFAQDSLSKQCVLPENICCDSPCAPSCDMIDNCCTNLSMDGSHHEEILEHQHNNQPVISPPGRSPVDLAHELYQAGSEVSPVHFFSILQTAMTLFAHDKEAFKTFLDTRNNLGWTALMHAAMTGDQVHLTALIRMLKQYYGDDQQSVYDYVIQRSPAGYTALGFSAQLGKVGGLTMLVDGIADLLAGNKKLFLNWLNMPDFVNENNPLISLVYDSEHDAIRYLVTKAETFFGESSREFSEFINYQDVVGFTPLQYAVDVRDRSFLKRHHAVIKKAISPAIIEAEKLGERLIESMHQDDLGSFKKHLYRLEMKYKDRPDLFIYAIQARNGAGWTTLIHATAHQSIVYLKILIQAIENILGKSPSDIFDALGAIDHLGRTGLIIAVQRENFEGARYLIEKILQYSKNKYYFYNYIVTQAANNGFTALFSGVYKSQGYGPLYDFVKFFLEKMATVFGKESRDFERFINERDFNNYTALDYADSKEMNELLVNFGARYGSFINKRVKRDLAAASKL